MKKDTVKVNVSFSKMVSASLSSFSSLFSTAITSGRYVIVLTVEHIGNGTGLPVLVAVLFLVIAKLIAIPKAQLDAATGTRSLTADGLTAVFPVIGAFRQSIFCKHFPFPFLIQYLL